MTRRRFALLLVIALIAAVGADASRAPDRQVTAAVAIAAIHAYRATLSPVLATYGLRCRFRPSCSEYAEASLRKHGIAGGGWRAARRLIRCGPWTPAGTVDPPE